MTNLFMQGMRRSGTTIFYDILSQDPRWTAFYEPFSKGKPGALGGGSGLQDKDLMRGVRSQRERFAAQFDAKLTDDDFNLGAPTDPAREVGPGWPPHAAAYLQHLSGGGNTLIKFTRCYDKLESLASVDPDAKLLILTRDPRAVASSYLLGKDQVRAPRFPDADTWFGSAFGINAWNSKRLGALAYEQSGHRALIASNDLVRILALWAYKVGNTMAGARRAFEGRFEVARHESLTQSPAACVDAIYRFVGHSAPDAVIDFAEHNVRTAKPVPFANDPRWQHALETAGATSIAQRLGYWP